jgi:formylglycine-generating enzyme required for sulfatase activity
MPNNPSQFQGNANPVEMVNWDDIQPFLQKTGLSLPSEAQWEYVCRAGTTTAFSFGGALTKEQANHGATAKRTSPVGTRRKNAWGFADMHGNVLEWCADGYQRDYPGDGANESPVSGTERVMRGGAWGLTSPRCRAAYRAYDKPSARHSQCGFRVVKML